MYTVNVVKPWDLAFNDQMLIKDLVPKIEEEFKSNLPAELFAEVKPFFDEMHQLPLTCDLSEVEDFDVEAFDTIMARMLNWADDRRVLVKTARWT